MNPKDFLPRHENLQGNLSNSPTSTMKGPAITWPPKGDLERHYQLIQRPRSTAFPHHNPLCCYKGSIGALRSQSDTMGQHSKNDKPLFIFSSPGKALSQEQRAEGDSHLSLTSQPVSLQATPPLPPSTLRTHSAVPITSVLPRTPHEVLRGTL